MSVCHPSENMNLCSRFLLLFTCQPVLIRKTSEYISWTCGSVLMFMFIVKWWPLVAIRSVTLHQLHNVVGLGFTWHLFQHKIILTQGKQSNQVLRKPDDNNLQKKKKAYSTLSVFMIDETNWLCFYVADPDTFLASHRWRSVIHVRSLKSDSLHTSSSQWLHEVTGLRQTSHHWVLLTYFNLIHEIFLKLTKVFSCLSINM